jgi:hypothetical protein
LHVNYESATLKIRNGLPKLKDFPAEMGGSGDTLQPFRQKADPTGTGYQTEINRVLREYLASGGRPITLDALRQIIREELHAA